MLIVEKGEIGVQPRTLLQFEPCLTMLLEKMSLHFHCGAFGRGGARLRTDHRNVEFDKVFAPFLFYIKSNTIFL
jgi:hypothetical protein